MRLFLAVFTIFVLAFAQMACSGDAGKTSGEQDANAVPVPPEFASAADALAEGTRLFDNGDTVKAIDVLLEAVKLDPDLAEAYFKLGIAYSLVEKADDTAEATPTPDGNSDQKKPKEVKSNSEKAFTSAVRAYKKLIAANKEDDNAYFYLGLSYNKLGEDADAARALQEAVKLKPDDVEYQTELGAVQIKLAKYHEAVSTLKKALDLDAENIKAQELLEKAEAGANRIEYTPVKKDDKNTANSNSNQDVDDEMPPPSNANTAKSTNHKPSIPKPFKTPTPAKTPH